MEKTAQRESGSFNKVTPISLLITILPGVNGPLSFYFKGMTMRFITLIFMILLTLGMGTKRPTIPTPPRPDIGVEELPARSERLVEIEVKSLKGFNGEQELRFRHIVVNLKNVVNLKAFEEKIKGHSYLGKNIFVDTTDTPEQVFLKVTSQSWPLEYRLESMRSSTVGYTLPKVSWIALNSGKWYSLSDADIAANIAHEYAGHKLGRYSHSQKWNRARDFSTPYALGTIVRDLYKRTVK
jgi:hypothetical protein